MYHNNTLQQQDNNHHSSPSLHLIGVSLHDFLSRTHHHSTYYHNHRCVHDKSDIDDDDGQRSNMMSSLSLDKEQLACINEWKVQLFAFLDSEVEQLSSSSSSSSLNNKHDFDVEHEIDNSYHNSGVHSSHLLEQVYYREEMKEMVQQMKSIITHQWLPTVGSNSGSGNRGGAVLEYDPDHEYSIHRRAVLAIWRFYQSSGRNICSNGQNLIDESLIESVLNTFDEHLTCMAHESLMKLYYGRPLLMNKKRLLFEVQRHDDSSQQQSFFYSYLKSDEVESLVQSLKRVQSEYETYVSSSLSSSTLNDENDDDDDSQFSSSSSSDSEAQAESDDEPMSDYYHVPLHKNNSQNNNNKRRRMDFDQDDDEDQYEDVHFNGDDLAVERESDDCLMDSVELLLSAPSNLAKKRGNSSKKKKKRDNRRHSMKDRKKKRVERAKYPSLLSEEHVRGLQKLIDRLDGLSANGMDLFVVPQQSACNSK